MGSPYREPGLYGPGYFLFSVAVGLLVAVMFSLSIRLYSKSMSRRGVGLDDCMIIIACMFDIVMASLTIVEVYYGYGNAQVNLATSDVAIALQMFWLTQIFYKVVICLTKLSFLSFYLDVFPQNGWTYFRIADYSIAAFLVLYYTASVLSTIAQCHPIALSWDKTVQGFCVNLTAFWYTNTGVSILSDLMVIILPITICYKLQITRKAKLGLCLVFSVGIFVIGTSIARGSTLKTSAKSVDQTLGSYESTVWTTVEANTAIICACLPSFKRPLKALYVRFCPSGLLSEPGNNRGVALDRDGREGMLHLGDIAVRTDVDVQFEQQRSRDASVATIGSHEAKTEIEAHEIA